MLKLRHINKILQTNILKNVTAQFTNKNEQYREILKKYRNVTSLPPGSNAPREGHIKLKTSMKRYYYFLSKQSQIFAQSIK